MSNASGSTVFDRPARATLQAIAADTGLSLSTVSQTLRGTGRIGAQTRERVMESSARLGYRPNISALHMRGSRTGLVAMISRLPSSSSWGVSDLDFLVRCERAFCEAALEAGHYPMILSSEAAAQALATVPLDGVAVIDPVRSDPLLDSFVDAGIAFVTLGRDTARPELDEWSVDNAKFDHTQQALDALYSRSMRHLALITAGTGQNYMTDVAAAVAEWSTRHPEVVVDIVELAAPFDPLDSEAAVRALCAAGVDTVYLAVETSLDATMRAIADAGRRVPEDVQVIAASDSVRARAGRPSVSAVDLHPDRLGKRLFSLLAQRITTGTSLDNAERVVAADLEFRTSTRDTPAVD